MRNYDIDPSTINSAYQLAQLEKEMEHEVQNKEIEEIRKENRQNAPIIEQLRRLSEQTQQQNQLLREENQRQQKQIIQAQENEMRAIKREKKNKIFSWLTFSVATVISVASLVVAIIAIL